MKDIQIFVPASIANLGPGLDTLAVAVQLYLRLRVEGIAEDRPNSLEFRFVDQKLEGENFIERAFRFLAEKDGADFPALRVEVRSEIPMQAGLGSSAAATVAGLRLYESVTQSRPHHELLNAAAVLEGHPDNVAAALFGGLTCSCQLRDGSVTALACRWPESLRFIVLTPEVRLKTLDSRAVLPQAIRLADAVFNLQRVVLLLQSLQVEEFEHLREALQDRWHQPYRQPLVPGLENLLALDHPHLLGVCLSGSGPSIVALARQSFSEIEDLLSRSYEPLDIPFKVRTLSVHQREVKSRRSQVESRRSPSEPRP
jgi:homoserine kinase